MPLCMKHLHGGLRKESHLKHWGRLQYGLFLKGAGMELEDATRFFELAFSKVTPHDKFQKDYAYSFRHMYGKEGARKNYTPYSCMKIIMGTPPEVGGFHGCPYRHMPENQLSALLGSMSIGGQDAKGTFLSRAGVARMRQTRLSSPAQGGDMLKYNCIDGVFSVCAAPRSRVRPLTNTLHHITHHNTHYTSQVSSRRSRAATTR